MMPAAVLDHQRDSAAELLVDIFNGQRIPAQQRVNAAADFEQRNVLPRQLPYLHHHFRVAARVVGIDAGNLVRIRSGPGVGVFPAPAHTDKGGLPGQATLFGKKSVPRVPLFAGLERRARLDIGDVKASPKQFDFRLGLVVPVTASPGPRLAGSRRMGNNHNTAPLALDLVFDPILLIIRGLLPFDCQARFIHQEVLAVESVPGGLRSFPTRGRNWRGFPRHGDRCRDTHHE